MNRKIVPVLLFIFLTIVMFYPVFLKGHIPFPGDLLVSEYQPWKSYSHNGIAPGGVPNKAQYFDAIRQMYPWQTITNAIIKQHQFPLWNPYNFSGTPLFANVQSAVLYPPKLLYFILPQPVAWTILVILQSFLSMLFMFWYMRIVGVSKKGAVFSGISYAYCLFASTFLEYNTMNHILALLPLSLLCVEHLKKRFTVFWALILTLSVPVGFFAGHIQVWSGFIAFILLYSLIRLLRDSENSKRIYVFFQILILVFLGIGISAIQFLPTAELILQSARTNQLYTFLIENSLIQPHQLILYLIPDLFGNPVNRNYLLQNSYPAKCMYIGLAPFIVAVFTLWSAKKNEMIKTFWLIFLIFGLFIIRTPLADIFYKIPIPFLSTSSPSNLIFLLSMCLSVLAGFGFDAFITMTRQRIVHTLLIFFGLFILTFLFSKLFHGSISIKNYLFSLGLFGIVSCSLLAHVYIPKLRVLFVLLLLFLTFSDLFYFFQKFNPFVPVSYMYPDNSLISWLNNTPEFNRIWGYGGAGFQENIASQLQYFSTEGYDPIYPKHYGKLIQSSKDGNLPSAFTNQTRSDAVIYPGWGETDMSSNLYRQKILGLTGTKYILTRVEDPVSDKTFPIDTYSLIDQFDGWKIFQFLSALPRVFVANKFKLYNSDNEFQTTFFQPSFDPKAALLLEEKPDIVLSDAPLVATATITAIHANTVDITASSNQPSLLFLSDTYYPGWNAYVNNEKTKIFRAHYAFRAIVIPEGKHQIEFRYEPDSFTLGLKISLGCIMLTLGFLLYNKFHAE